jgi:3-hydroxybutyrate dehydrogenase
MLKGKGALITGSTQGLGYAMAQRLAAEGCNVMLNGFGDGAEIERRRLQLEEGHGMRAFHHGADLAEPGQIAALVDAAKGSLGTVDILINNAVVRHFAPIESFRPEDWDKALAVNLSAAFHTSRLVLPGMRARDYGRIVNISSIYGQVGAVNRVDYVTTKTALIGFTRAVALETAGQDITCNAICPGTVPTPAIGERLAAFMAKEGLAREAGEKAFMASRQPSGRFVAPEGVAALVALLCGPGGRDITGAAIPVDGGWSAS